MTPKQLKSIIQHYKKRAAEENMMGYDLEKRNRLLKMARELEDNFEEYLEYEYSPDDLDTTLDLLVDRDDPTSLLERLFYHPDDNLSLDDEMDLIDYEDIEDARG
ncbi:MAG: hypothetical protein IJT51_08725 [Bacteroidales bacterium]|nr:hypothetical protein [Bacteroidales bacterium]